MVFIRTRNHSVAISVLFFVVAISVFVFVVVPRWLWPAAGVSHPDLVIPTSDQAIPIKPRRPIRVMKKSVYPDSHLLQVNVFNLSFFVSAKHHQWVQKNEKGCLAVVDDALSSRKGHCTTYDIGMNDGFYTQLFSAYGCRTWSFELHPECINISQKALKRNGFSHLVNISHLAISDSNKIVTVPKSPKCEGSLSISRKSSQVSTFTPTLIVYDQTHPFCPCP